MDTLHIIGMIIGWLVLFAGLIGAYWKLKMKDQALSSDIKAVSVSAEKSVAGLEKEYIKELNDVDDKMERVFESLKKYLTTREYELMEETRSLKVKAHVSQEVKGLKDEIGQTFIDFEGKLAKMFKDMQKTIEKNGSSTAG